ncbi:hypothetical protein CFter6_0309 [Collimonas fungivorans]|uniref:Uncharacterized protein n=1 Tax=Collimonas fungivorans TaxID=158899 RepID=A0A127P5C0_9BURK|nr:hypothetical protein CFter6_0309 [Collimonas fungivorans]
MRVELHYAGLPAAIPDVRGKPVLLPLKSTPNIELKVICA